MKIVSMSLRVKPDDVYILNDLKTFVLLHDHHQQ